MQESAILSATLDKSLIDAAGGIPGNLTRGFVRIATSKE